MTPHPYLDFPNAEAVEGRAAHRLQEQYTGPRRREGEPNFGDRLEKSVGRIIALCTLGSIVLGALVAVGTMFLDARYLNKAQAQDNLNAVTQRMDANDARELVRVEELRANQVEANRRLDAIDKAQRRVLVLSLLAAQRSLKADLDALPPGTPGRANLADQLDAVNIDLKAIGQ